MRVKKCILVALFGSAKRDLNSGAAGAICVVRVDCGFAAAFTIESELMFSPTKSERKLCMRDLRR